MNQPLHEDPVTARMPAELESDLLHALRDVDLSAEEQRVLHWVAETWTTPMVAMLVDLLERTRTQGGVDVLEIEDALRRKAREARSGPRYDLDGNIPLYAQGNSGAGWRPPRRRPDGGAM